MNQNSFIVDFSVELQRTMKPDLVSLDFINEYAILERQMVNSFQSNAVKNIREGNLKKSFNYLLIDPRISENLLAESQVKLIPHCGGSFLLSIILICD